MIDKAEDPTLAAAMNLADAIDNMRNAVYDAMQRGDCPLDYATWLRKNYGLSERLPEFVMMHDAVELD